MGDFELVRTTYGRPAKLAIKVKVDDSPDPNQQWSYEVEGDLMWYPENWVLNGANTLRVSSGDSDLLVSNVLTKAYASAAQSEILTGEQILTASQTLAMLHRPFKSARDLLSRMAKSRARRLGKTAQSAARATADTWLEYRYGWKPLLLDADTIIGSVTELGRPLRKRLVARAHDKIEYKTQLNLSGAPLGWLGIASGSATLTSSVTVDAGVFVDIYCPTTAEHLVKFFGLRPRDVLPTLWELTPYSFVCDWFMNVGDWLQAMLPVPGVTFGANWVTRKVKTEANIDVSNFTVNVAGKFRSSGGGGQSSYLKDAVTRKCDQTLASYPEWTAKSLSTLHSADAVALSAGQILNGLRKWKH
jgi:hypothetical protein